MNNHTPLKYFLLTILLCLNQSVLYAQFSLNTNKLEGEHQIFEVVFHSTGIKSNQNGEIPGPRLPEFEELGYPEWTPLPPPPAQTSTLLAIQGDRHPNPEDWKLEVVGKDSTHNHAFTMTPVQVGPFTAIHLVADLEGLPVGTWKLIISGPVLTGKGGISLSPDDGEITRGLFLNGDQLIPTRPKTGKSALPTPPAPYRVRYTLGEKLAHLVIPDQLSSPTIRLTHQGRLLSWDPESSMVYLPERTNIQTDQHDVVFVGQNPAQPSPTMATRDAFTTLTPQGVEVALERSRYFRRPKTYQRSTPLPIGERIVEFRVQRNETRTEHYPFRDRLTSPTVTIEVTSVGLNTLPAFDPDHYAAFSLGGIPAPEYATWKGRTVNTFSFSADLELTEYPGGPNQRVQFIHHVPPIPGGPNADVQVHKSVTLSWLGYPRIGQQRDIRLEVPPIGTGPRRLTVGGFPTGTQPSDVILVDVTNDANPVIIANPVPFTDASGTVAFEWENSGGGAVYHIALRSHMMLPITPMPTDSLPTLPTTTLRGIYVTPKEYQENIKVLLDHRGPGFVLLDPDAAYDIYSHGQESPDAIRQALAALIDAAPIAMEFPSIVLVGHATFDHRNHLGLITAPQIPTFVDESIDTAFTIENCVDFPYALLFGDDNFVDAHVSRFPALTTMELDHMVSRTITMELMADELTDMNRPGVFVYDNDPGFLLDRQTWINKWSWTNRPLREVILDGSDINIKKQQFASHMAESPRGPAFVTYVGHGNNTVWASPNLVRAADVNEIDTANGYPFITTFTCLNSYYAFPGASVRSLAERWLLAPMGSGASASYAPCSVDFYSAQKIKLGAFMDLISDWERPASIGGMVTRARLAFATTAPHLTLTNREYLLFGDNLTPTTLSGVEEQTSVSDWMDLLW